MKLDRSPAPDFDHPVEMLAACHDRIEDQLRTLERLREHLAANGCDEQARGAAANVIRYFDTAGEFHHEDEERDLFPALMKAANQDEEIARVIARLVHDHEQMRRLWKDLRLELQAIGEGRSRLLNAEIAERFSALYRAHIEREEADLLPAAQRTLSADELSRIGAAMAARRGVKH